MKISIDIPLLPRFVFLTKGVGVAQSPATSLQQALFTAGIGQCNIVQVTYGILPPTCKVIPRERGLGSLVVGQVIHCVLSIQTDTEPNRHLSTSIGLAWTQDLHRHGYLYAYSSEGETRAIAGDHAEDSAASMLATTLGIEMDPQTAWREKEQVFKAQDKTIRTKNICQSRRVNKDGLSTTVITAAVFLT